METLLEGQKSDPPGGFLLKAVSMGPGPETETGDWGGGCTQQTRAQYETYAPDWGRALSAALVPIPIAWLIAYGLVGLMRWIRRGFIPST
jgi:hypothetical protein